MGQPEETVEQETPKQRPFIEPGHYPDLSNEDYHGSFGWSSSQLKVLLEKTPAHLVHQYTHQKEPTDAMQMGTLVHTLVFEPEEFDNVAAQIPTLNLRTKQGKEDMANFQELHQGKILINQEQLDKANAMATSVKEHPTAGLLLADAVTEQSVYWWYKSMDPDDDEHYKIMLKVRPDILSRSYPVVMDLKSCIDASFTGFANSINKFGYHVSAAMYLEGVNQCKPLLEQLGHFACTKFIFICVENSEPYLPAVYELSQEYLEIGKAWYRKSLRLLKDGLAGGMPGFPEEVRVIEPPAWAHRAHIV